MTAEGPQHIIPAPKKKKSKLRSVWGVVLPCAIAAVIYLFTITFLFEPIRVDGRSMQNTLHDGEFMIATKLDYLLSDPSRFDVVICRYPGEGNTRFVKRIVGIPGDRIRIAGGALLINGEAADEPYIDFPPNYAMEEVTVTEGRYFVLGDNRASSMDSHIVGQLTREQILGHVQLVFWPLGTVRAI